MSQATSIQWTDATWNPIRGCSRISPGCVNCYAERQALRFSGPGKPFEGFVQLANGHAQWTGKVGIVENHLSDPLKWRKPRRIFVNSMSDLFHEGMSDADIDRVFCVMAMCPQHTFQILTKRSERMRKYLSAFKPGPPLDGFVTRGGVAHSDTKRGEFLSSPDRWPLPNVWLGVSIENQECADKRIPDLLATPAAVRFVSYEPALGPVKFKFMRARCSRCNMPNLYSDNPLGSFKSNSPLVDDARRSVWCPACGYTYDDVSFLNWIIVGGESGPGARPFNIEWARSVVRQCKAAGVSCFVKQLGAVPYGVRHNPEYRVWPHSKEFFESNNHVATKLADKKGGDMAEWPADLRVREFPKVAA